LDVPADAVEIIGHFHPAITLGDGAGLYLKVAALIQGPRRWILPAFSPWAAGVDWRERLESEETAWIASPKQIFKWLTP
jgi:metallophosphoesterase superfamily enzyme